MSSAYTELAEQMARTGIAATPADAHGMACGLLCAGVPDASAVWERELLVDLGDDVVLTPELQVMLQPMFARIEQDMERTDYVLRLYLPEDDSSIAERVAALSDWCRGFLFGIGFVGPGRLEHVTAESNEALHDLTEITHIDVPAAGSDASDDESLMEIEEYVRAAAMLLREDLHTSS